MHLHPPAQGTGQPVRGTVSSRDMPSPKGRLVGKKKNRPVSYQCRAHGLDLTQQVLAKVRAPQSKTVSFYRRPFLAFTVEVTCPGDGTDTTTAHSLSFSGIDK